jgi:hypothetical protein
MGEREGAMGEREMKRRTGPRTVDPCKPTSDSPLPSNPYPSSSSSPLSKSSSNTTAPTPLTVPYPPPPAMLAVPKLQSDMTVPSKLASRSATVGSDWAPRAADLDR